MKVSERASTPPPSAEIQQFAYEILRKEIEAVRDKAWKIFSWTSTILLGTIGGLIALVAKSSSPIDVLPCWPHRALLLLAIVVLTIYASLWVRQNMKFEEALLKQVEAFETAIGVRQRGAPINAKPWFGYRLTIVLLAVAALTAIWLIPTRCALP